jgi:hypothetical protein
MSFSWFYAFDISFFLVLILFFDFIKYFVFPLVDSGRLHVVLVPRPSKVKFNGTNLWKKEQIRMSRILKRRKREGKLKQVINRNRLREITREKKNSSQQPAKPTPNKFKKRPCGRHLTWKPFLLHILLVIALLPKSCHGAGADVENTARSNKAPSWSTVGFVVVVLLVAVMMMKWLHFGFGPSGDGDDVLPTTNKHQKYRERKRKREETTQEQLIEAKDNLEKMKAESQERLRERERIATLLTCVEKCLEATEKRVQKMEENERIQMQQLVSSMTFKTTLTNLFLKMGKEVNVCEFLEKEVRKCKETCPGVTNEIHVGFALNYYTGGVVVSGKIVGLPENKEKIRSVDCQGSDGKSKCSHCSRLATQITQAFSDHGTRGALGPFSDIQESAMQEKKREHPSVSEKVTK